jgi:hypothetical protein
MFLLTFGLFTWMSGMLTADAPVTDLVTGVAAAQAGMGAGLFVVSLLPGRVARFS